MNSLKKKLAIHLKEMEDDDYVSAEQLKEILEEKQEENDAHFFQLGYKWCHAKFRHMLKQLESDPDHACEVLARYLNACHEEWYEDNGYRDAYIASEEDAEFHVSKFDTPGGKL